MDELENILENLVRVGTVTDVDGAGRCRVKFQDTGITSDWLAVLQRPGTGQPHPHGRHQGRPCARREFGRGMDTDGEQQGGVFVSAREQRGRVCAGTVMS